MITIITNHIGYYVWRWPWNELIEKKTWHSYFTILCDFSLPAFCFCHHGRCDLATGAPPTPRLLELVRCCRDEKSRAAETLNPVNRREIFFKLSALGADRTEWTVQKNVCKTHVGNMGVISELVTQWRRWRENIGCFVVAQQESRVCISDLWPGTPGKKWPGGSFHSTFTPRRE